MCDKLVYDLSQEVEGTPNIFIRKDWINIMDNMNTNYQTNQSIIDTSQLSNSNKWMNYREAYLAVPMLLTLKGDALCTNNTNINDFAIGLKNWFGSVIHSLTLDYNGTVAIQQTPFINMWNIFKLLTSLSYNDVLTMGSTIGFYPDETGSFKYFVNNSSSGVGVCNNDNAQIISSVPNLQNNTYGSYVATAGVSGGGNYGLTSRTKWIAFDGGAGTGTYNAFLSTQSASQIWKSHISYGRSSDTVQVAGVAYPTQQISVMGIIYLKHLASFFNMIPLLKGVFMKLTLNLNNATSTINVPAFAAGNAQISSYTSNVPIGGVNPLLIPSTYTGSSWLNNCYLLAGAPTSVKYNLSIGSRCTDPSIVGVNEGAVSKSIYLYVPAYSFNPTFEEAYLSSSPKTVKYTDVYQYNVLNQSGQVNALITNGIPNIKSVLVIPYLSNIITTGGVAPASGNQWQSPFDTAGCGTTAPLSVISNFNIQISGQNAIYNSQRYNFEEFVNQLHGENAVNGGMTDGLTSGLIDFMSFQNSQCYYYVNVERMLPVEKSVPKSVQITGNVLSAMPLNLWVFIEYETEIRVDLYTGARV